VGYDPKVYYTGRSPLEAANMGIDLGDNDVAMRANLVTLSDEENFADKTMVDYCAGDISTAEAKELIAAVQEAMGNDIYSFYPGVSYRHCLVWKDGTVDIGTLTTPHDISGKVIGPHLNDNPLAKDLIAMMEKSNEILKDHPVNIKRIEKGKRPATHIWLWGQGSRPKLADFKEKTGLKGTMISAVDLLKGIARCSGMEIAEVEGATGYIDTNFEGKMQAAVDALKKGQDYVYIHVEAPDECGHRGETANKAKAISIIDQTILGPLLKEVKEMDDFTLLIMPDHPTPLCTMTHCADPVPYLLYRSNEHVNGPEVFTEKTATDSGILIEKGYTLIDRMLKNN
jgi:2,3-bisphosphoglycerate-independent phosphoglycerate mutase